MPDLDLDILLKLQDRATGPLQRSLGKIDKQSQKSTRGLANLGRTLRSHWLAATAVIAGVGFVLTKITKAAIDFEDAFAGVRKTVDATEEEFAQLNAGLREMAKTIPTTVVELAEIQTIAGQLGVRGVKNLTKFTEVVAKIAVTTNLTREAAATNFARIANIMQEPLDMIDRMGSSVVELGNNFATTEAEIVNFATRIAGASRVVGLSTADIFGFGTAFSSVGVQAQRGGTAVSKALILMSTAAAEGGEKLEEFAAIAGLTSKEFARTFEEDAGKAFALFIEGLGKSGRRGAEILKELELGDQRLIQAFLSVGGASGILTRAIEQSNEAWKINNALSEEAAKRFGTTASQIQIFQNNVNDLNISLGENFLPTLINVLDALTRFIDKVGLLVREDIGAIAFPVDVLIPTEQVIEAQRIWEETTEGMKGFSEEFLAFQNELWDQYGRTLDATLEEGVLAYQERYAEIEEIVKKSTKEQTKLNEKAAEKETKIQAGVIKKAREERIKAIQSQIESTSFFFDFLAQTVNMAAAENRKFAVLAKAVRIGQAIINTATAVTRAYADFPFPVSAAVAGIVSGLGAAQVAIIAGQKFHEGGIVKAHDGLAVDEVPIIAQRGEGVLSRRGMASLGGTDMLNRINQGQAGFGDIIIENASFKDEEGIEDVVEQISTALEERRRARIV